MSFDTFKLVTVFRKITIFEIPRIIFWIDSAYRCRWGCSVIQKSIILILFRFCCLVRWLKKYFKFKGTVNNFGSNVYFGFFQLYLILALNVQWLQLLVWGSFEVIIEVKVGCISPILVISTLLHSELTLYYLTGNFAYIDWARWGYWNSWNWNFMNKSWILNLKMIYLFA